MVPLYLHTRFFYKKLMLHNMDGSGDVCIDLKKLESYFKYFLQYIFLIKVRSLSSRNNSRFWSECGWGGVMGLGGRVYHRCSPLEPIHQQYSWTFWWTCWLNNGETDSRSSLVILVRSIDNVIQSLDEFKIVRYHVHMCLCVCSSVIVCITMYQSVHYTNMFLWV